MDPNSPEMRKKKKSPEINSHTYGQLIYIANKTRIHNREKNLFSKQHLENWTAEYKRIKLEHFLTLYTKETKLIKNLNKRNN